VEVLGEKRPRKKRKSSTKGAAGDAAPTTAAATEQEGDLNLVRKKPSCARGSFSTPRPRTWMEDWVTRRMMDEDEEIQKEEKTGGRENLGVEKCFDDCLPATQYSKIRRMLAQSPDWGLNLAFSQRVLKMERARRAKLRESAVVDLEDELVLEEEMQWEEVEPEVGGEVEVEGGQLQRPKPRRKVVKVKNLLADRTLSAVALKGEAGMTTRDWNKNRFLKFILLLLRLLLLLLFFFCCYQLLLLLVLLFFCSLSPLLFCPSAPSFLLPQVLARVEGRDGRVQPHDAVAEEDEVQDRGADAAGLPQARALAGS